MPHKKNLCDCGLLKDARYPRCIRCNGKKRIIHGMSDSHEFRVWARIIRRCYDTNYMNYKYYGAREISVCPEWRNSFLQFLKDVGFRPTTNHEIERINNDGNYEPSNVRWATHKEQSRNKRTSVYLEFMGKRQCLAAWSEELLIPMGRLQYRVKKGWSAERALTERKRKNQFV